MTYGSTSARAVADRGMCAVREAGSGYIVSKSLRKTDKPVLRCIPKLL